VARRVDSRLYTTAMSSNLWDINCCFSDIVMSIVTCAVLTTVANARMNVSCAFLPAKNTATNLLMPTIVLYTATGSRKDARNARLDPLLTPIMSTTSQESSRKGKGY